MTDYTMLKCRYCLGFIKRDLRFRNSKVSCFNCKTKKNRARAKKFKVKGIVDKSLVEN